MWLLLTFYLLLTVPWVGLQFVIMVFPDHTHLLFSFIILVTFNERLTKLLAYVFPGYMEATNQLS